MCRGYLYIFAMSSGGVLSHEIVAFSCYLIQVSYSADEVHIAQSQIIRHFRDI